MNMDFRTFIAIMIPIFAISIIGFTYVIYHDLGIDVKNFTRNWTCDDIKNWLDTEGQKISKSPWTNEIKEVYNEKKCEEK